MIVFFCGFWGNTLGIGHNSEPRGTGATWRGICVWHQIKMKWNQTTNFGSSFIEQEIGVCVCVCVACWDECVCVCAYFEMKQFEEDLYGSVNLRNVLRVTGTTNHTHTHRHMHTLIKYIRMQGERGARWRCYFFSFFFFRLPHNHNVAL